MYIIEWKYRQADKWNKTNMRAGSYEEIRKKVSFLRIVHPDKLFAVFQLNCSYW